MKICLVSNKENEKGNFLRDLYSNKHQIKTGTKTKCINCKKVYCTEEKNMSINLKITKE